MKKIKKLWNDNRVMFVLGIVVILCVIIMMFVMIKYFFGTSSSNYGDRLESISSVPFDADAKELIQNSFNSEHTLDVSVDVRGKVVYIIAKFNPSVSLDDAKKEAVDVYNKIDEKYRSLYDFNVTLLQDVTEINTGYCLMGAKNVSGEYFVWSNNTPVADGE